jgi:hypothetical protein
MALWGRRAVVQIDTLRVEGLDVRFAVEMNAKTYGKAEVSIFNLNKDHREKLEDSKSVDVELSVGYETTDLDLLFKGTLREIFSERDSSDWVSTLRMGDGDKASPARIARSYKSGTKKETIWKDLVDSLKTAGIDPGNAITMFQNSEYANGIKELLHGGAFHGSALPKLKGMARDANLDVSIQDGALVVTPLGEALETTAIVLGPDSGLIGSPKKGTKGELKIRALILPGLRPKRKIEIRKGPASGMYVIQKAKYKGDTSGNDWYADLVCKGL